jgi:transporter family protein
MNIETIIFLILAIICWGGGAFFDKLSLKYIDPSNAFLARTIAMLILFVPLLYFKFSQVYKTLMSSSKYSWLYIFLSVLVSMAGVFFYLKAMSMSQASKIVPISSTYPLITLILAMLFLGEKITINIFIGTLLISTGIYFVTK